MVLLVTPHQPVERWHRGQTPTDQNHILDRLTFIILLNFQFQLFSDLFFIAPIHIKGYLKVNYQSEV